MGKCISLFHSAYWRPTPHSSFTDVDLNDIHIDDDPEQWEVKKGPLFSSFSTRPSSAVVRMMDCKYSRTDPVEKSTGGD